MMDKKVGEAVASCLPLIYGSDYLCVFVLVLTAGAFSKIKPPCSEPLSGLVTSSVDDEQDGGKVMCPVNHLSKALQ